MLKPALQGVDRGRAKLKLRVVDVKALPSRDSIAFVSQSASPATYAWVKVDGVQNYESRLAELLPTSRSAGWENSNSFLRIAHDGSP